jgi:hypothetical protein
MKKNYNAPVQKKDRGCMTNYKQIPNSNDQNYKPRDIHASMQSCIHADIKGIGKSNPYDLLLTTYYLLPTTYFPLVAEGKKK